jgi:hypothetical protein
MSDRQDGMKRVLIVANYTARPMVKLKEMPMS